MNWFKKSLTVLLATITLFGTGISTPIVAEDGDTKGETATTKVAETTTATSDMPAKTFVGTADNGVNVTATVDEGVFATGTTMTVRSVASETAKSAAENVIDDGKVVVDVLAVDITFRDAAGNEIEPSDSAKVHVELSTQRTVEGESHEAIHVKDDGSAEKVAGATTTAAGSTFTSNSFSIYAIIGENTATRTYNFWLFMHTCG